MGTQGNDLTAGDLTVVEMAAVGLLITGPGA